jgi:hypothetical protein
VDGGSGERASSIDGADGEDSDDRAGSCSGLLI